MLALFKNFSETDKSEAIENLIDHSTPRQDFFLMVILSVAMATLGLLLNSVAIIIGSMLIAPLLYPILSLALGVAMADSKLIRRSIGTLFKAILWGFVVAALVAWFFLTPEYTMSPEILARTEPSFAYGLIALIAGLAAAFAIIKPHLNATLPGVAIAVALLPPLAVAGIGFSAFDGQILKNAFLLLFMNIGAIVFAGLIIFSLMDVYLKRWVADKAMEKQEVELQAEKPPLILKEE